MEIDLLKLYYQLLRYQLENLKYLKKLTSMCEVDKDLKTEIEENYKHIFITQKELLIHFEDILDSSVESEIKSDVDGKNPDSEHLVNLETITEDKDIEKKLH